MNIKWSAEDKQFIKDSAAELKDKDLAKESSFSSTKESSFSSTKSGSS